MAIDPVFWVLYSLVIRLYSFRCIISWIERYFLLRLVAPRYKSPQITTKLNPTFWKQLNVVLGSIVDYDLLNSFSKIQNFHNLEKQFRLAHIIIGLLTTAKILISKRHYLVFTWRNLKKFHDFMFSHSSCPQRLTIHIEFSIFHPFLPVKQIKQVKALIVLTTQSNFPISLCTIKRFLWFSCFSLR